MKKYRNSILAVCIFCLLLNGKVMIMTCSASTQSFHGEVTYEINDNGEVVITGGETGNSYFNGNSDYLEILNVIDGYRVIGIADRAFAYRQDLKKVIIGEGVRYIGAYAFGGCRNLHDLKLKDGMQSIGEGAFCDTRLTSVVLPNSVLAVDKDAFLGCGYLRQIEMPQHADIDLGAFEDTAWQEERDNGLFQIRGSCLKAINGNIDPVLNIPYGVTRLERGKGMLGPAILDDISLQTVYEEIIFPDTLTELGAVCMVNIKAKRIEIPGNVKYIPFGTFMYGNVSEIVLSEGIEIIGAEALSSIDGLETINIPESVRMIEDQAFIECGDLRRITIPGTVDSIGMNTFGDCKSLREVVYEEGIEVIGCGYADTQIKRIQFPESTVSIQGNLWRTQSLERVYIPSGAVNIHDDIFSIRVKFQYDPITVYGQKGSRAEELAIQSGYEFIEVESGDEMP